MKRDIHTTGIARSNHKILAALLKDQTLSTPERTVNISWATNDYAPLNGDIAASANPYACTSEITADVFDDNSDIIAPRVTKHEAWQTARSKNRAEVFTPAWICNAQNNLIDERWLGYVGAFNTEVAHEDGTRTWQTTTEPVTFPKGKSWMRYVRARRLEITCGEGPYLVSRYDTTTGERIAIGERIGMLDRKFRIINENTPSDTSRASKRQWLRRAYQALQSVYGFDWQGDNVFLTRESLLHSFCDYYINRWQRMPHIEAIMKAAEIISWNVWQMDGTSFAIPGTDQSAIIMEWHGTEPLSGKHVAYKDIVGK